MKRAEKKLGKRDLWGNVVVLRFDHLGNQPHCIKAGFTVGVLFKESLYCLTTYLRNLDRKRRRRGWFEGNTQYFIHKHCIWERNTSSGAWIAIFGMIDTRRLFAKLNVGFLLSRSHWHRIARRASFSFFLNSALSFAMSPASSFLFSLFSCLRVVL